MYKPTMSESLFQLEAQERRKMLKAPEHKLEYRIYQKTQNDLTVAFCEWLHSELKKIFQIRSQLKIFNWRFLHLYLTPYNQLYHFWAHCHFHAANTCTTADASSSIDHSGHFSPNPCNIYSPFNSGCHSRCNSRCCSSPCNNKYSHFNVHHSNSEIHHCRFEIKAAYNHQTLQL